MIHYAQEPELEAAEFAQLAYPNAARKTLRGWMRCCAARSW
jgi:hypothetical protein